jgi:hypothetical protein
MLDISQVEAVFIDDHGLQLDPALPGLFRNILEHTLAEIARQRRKIHTFGFTAKFYALHHTCHFEAPAQVELNVVDGSR